MRKKFSTYCLVLLMLFIITACGKNNKNIFGFLDIEIGDSKDKVVQKYGDEFAINQGDLYAYTSIDKAFDCEEQYVAFTFDSDNNISSISTTWTLKSEDMAKKLFTELKGIAIKQYGEDYESGEGDNPAEYARWADGKIAISVSYTNDTLNGYKVNINKKN